MLILLEAALNGGRSPNDNAAVPVSPAQLASAAADAAEAGAGAVHFHVRDADGRESLEAADVAAAVAAVRGAGVPFGVSTGAWIIPDPALRLATIEQWTAFPHFVSINFDEEGAGELASFFLRRGVAIEAGLANPAAAQRLVRSTAGPRCLRIMFEPREQNTGEALDTVAQTEAILDAAAWRVPRLLHGVNATAWSLLDAAYERGYASRIGFEDTLTLPGGEPASGNGELVREALARVAPGGRAEPMERR